MLNKLSKISVVVLCAGVVMVSGCRSKPKVAEAKIDPDNKVVITEMPGDKPLSSDWKTENMTRIPDSETQLETVLFAYDSYVVENSEFPKIQKAAALLKSNSKYRLEAEGNCDERGTKEYNQALGENRAAAVRTRLIECGVPAGNVLTKSFGEEKPIDPGHAEAAWKKNRRVEFAVYK